MKIDDEYKKYCDKEGNLIRCITCGNLLTDEEIEDGDFQCEDCDLQEDIDFDDEFYNEEFIAKWDEL